MDETNSFGYWLRRRRKALDLTQDELAQQVGCAAVTLRKIEADERRPSVQMALRLAHCLALSEQERRDFMAAAAGKQIPVALPRPISLGAHRPGARLPAPVTSLVGRGAEIAALIECLRQRRARLLTLTGPVGVGKTRLALEVGRRLLPDFRDGVCLVALASLQDPALLLSATAVALGARESRGHELAESLVDFLAARHMLLIFDNFEHLLPAAPFLARLLTAGPDLQILVTSRARLHLYGEHEFVVPPLALPDPSHPEAESPAIELFYERAQAVRAGFHPTPSLAPTIADICRRLDGLPLAIELAAARVRTLSPPELQQRLEHRLPLLVQDAADLPTHRQGLKQAIAWSFDLLGPAEQTLLCRLAVFNGGFSLPAAEAVCAGPADLADVAAGLGILLDHSLAARAESTAVGLLATTGRCGNCPLQQLHEVSVAESRYALLETIREFALERLQAGGELPEIVRCHAHYYAAWAQQTAEKLHGPEQAFCLARLEQESGNLRAALAWLLAAGEGAAAAGMACALGPFWQRHGHFSEGRRWLEQALAQLPPDPAAATLRARTLQNAAALAYRQGDAEAAQSWLAGSLVLFSAQNELSGMARVFFDQGWMALDRADWAEAAQLNEQSLSLARQANDHAGIYRALTNLGWARLCNGRQAEAGALFGQAHQTARNIGHSKGVAVSLTNLAWIAFCQGQPARAAAQARESMRLCHLLGERESLAEDLEILAAVEFAGGDAHCAARLIGAADSLWEALQLVRPPNDFVAAIRADTLAAAQRRLPEPDFSAAWNHGRAMNQDDTLALALGCTNASPTPAT